MEKGRKTETAEKYVRKYIDLGIKFQKQYSKRGIAKVMLDENPDVYLDIEDARAYIRYVTNSYGEQNKHDKYTDLEEGLILINKPVIELDYTPYIVPPAYNKTLIIADLHGLFCDMQSLEIAINYGIKHNCDSFIIDGDFLDFYQFSKFDKSNRIVEQFYEEQEWGVELLQLLQRIFGFGILKEGNHDARRQLYIERLPLVYEEIKLLGGYSDYLNYSGSNIQFIKDYNVINYGKLNIIHGHEFQGGGGIHVAYNRLNKAFDNIISAHSHVKQEAVRVGIDGEVYGSWTLGCLCNLHPRYNINSNWTHGFATVAKDESGFFEIQNKLIINKKIY